MKYGVLSSLLIVGFIIIWAGKNQNTVPSSAQTGIVLNTLSERNNQNDHIDSATKVRPDRSNRSGNACSSTIEPKDDESKYGELPEILRGTRMDGDLLSDMDGNLLIIPSIKKRFDYFLSAVSEEGLETSIGRIEENISQSLPTKASEEALSILYSYINYKKGLQNYLKDKGERPENSDQVADLRRIIETRMELRRKYMAQDVVDAFFGDQELYDEFNLKCLELHYDNTLTPEEKQNERRRLAKALPEKYRTDEKRKRT